MNYLLICNSYSAFQANQLNDLILLLPIINYLNLKVVIKVFIKVVIKALHLLAVLVKVAIDITIMVINIKLVMAIFNIKLVVVIVNNLDLKNFRSLNSSIN